MINKDFRQLELAGLPHNEAARGIHKPVSSKEILMARWRLQKKGTGPRIMGEG